MFNKKYIILHGHVSLPECNGSSMISSLSPHAKHVCFYDEMTPLKRIAIIFKGVLGCEIPRRMPSGHQMDNLHSLLGGLHGN